MCAGFQGSVQPLKVSYLFFKNNNVIQNAINDAIDWILNASVFTHAIAIGKEAINTANDQIIIGDNTYTDIKIGGLPYPPAAPLPTVDYTTPATGFNYTVPNGKTNAIIEPAGTLATGTINMPAVPTDGQRLTISSTQQITTLTMSGNGKTLNGALVTIGANGFATWQYRTATTSWYRIG